VAKAAKGCVAFQRCKMFRTNTSENSALLVGFLSGASVYQWKAGALEKKRYKLRKKRDQSRALSLNRC
jgi:hypothetical protein